MIEPEPLAHPEVEAYPMIAYHLAELLPIKRVTEEFADTLIDYTTTDATFRLGPDRYVMAYNFGSLVFFNVAPEQQEAILATVRGLCHPFDAEVTTDDFLVATSPTLRERVYFDRAVLSDLSPSKIQILALVLAQSATLEYYETVVEDLLDQAETVISPMKRTGKLPGYTRSTIRYIGISLSTRRDLISWLYIVDAPDITWQDSRLDRLFTQMKSTMEIDARYRALEYKLKLIQEGVEVIVDLTNAQRNIVLEITIVMLIVVEIVLALMVMH